MKEYNHKKIESKWQKTWAKSDLYKAEDNSDKPKEYLLVEFPYPSGDGLHVGHVRSYTALDIIARKKRMQGINVMYPMGWDAFGLPTENFAIKTGKHPIDVTKDNVAVFKKQMNSLGISFDWSREINTTDPKYYKWTQWIFLRLLKKGLAYKKKMPINWCPSCKIGLANEEVIDGSCERCGAETFKKDMEQWMLKITAYADRLIEDLETVDYLEKIKTQQINWIGRSYGAEVDFEVKGGPEKVKVFTTRPDTLFGATFMVLSPEHELVNKITTEDQKAEVLKYQEESSKKSDLERTELQKEKSGVFTGAYAINPMNGAEVPVWIADYVLATYGTGAIMAVPAHDQRDYDFAKKYNLDIIQVIAGGSIEKEAFTAVENGKLMNSGEFDGMPAKDAIENISIWLQQKELGKKTTNYHLRDWVFSRQHYWGEPIPVVYCPNCGIVPVPEDQLPLELPMVEKYEPTDTGESPLAAIDEWVNCKCPLCGVDSKRETDTMPNWAGSSWYFLRYIDPDNDEVLADPDKLKHWMPIDLYNGGMEHTTLHLLYSRFWNKFLYDEGIVPTSEPYQRRVSHGMILASDGNKMSKSKGNVLNPDDIVEEYGADSLRMYEMFMGPYDQPVSWDVNGLRGIYKFLDRVFHMSQAIAVGAPGWQDKTDVKVKKELEKTIKKVTEDIEKRKFNTAVSQLMIFNGYLKADKVNNLGETTMISKDDYGRFIAILAPFSPHLCEEIWYMLGNEQSVFKNDWPQFDPRLIVDDEIELPVQVNGKVRDTLNVSPDIAADEIEKLVLASEKVQKYLDGKEPKKIIYVKGRIVSVVV